MEAHLLIWFPISFLSCAIPCLVTISHLIHRLSQVILEFNVCQFNALQELNIAKSCVETAVSAAIHKTCTKADIGAVLVRAKRLFWKRAFAAPQMS